MLRSDASSETRNRMRKRFSGAPGNTRRNGTPIAAAVTLQPTTGTGGGLNSHSSAGELSAGFHSYLAAKGDATAGMGCNSKPNKFQRSLTRIFQPVTLW